MRNWKYISGAEGVKIGNYGVSLDSAGARQVREMAAKLWTSGMHNSRDIAMAIAFEIAKTSKAMQENKADVVSNIQDMVDRWIKEVKTGNSIPEKLEKDVEKKDKEKVDEVKKLEKVENYSKGEVIYQQGSLKYIYGGETNGTHIVYEQPKGKAHTFSSEDEIKSWLRLGNKVGNSCVGNRSWRTEKNGDRVTIYLNDWKAGWGEAKWSTVGWQTDGYTYGMTPSGMKEASAFRKVYGDKKPSLEQIEKDLKEDFWIHHNDKETMARVGNRQKYDTGDEVTVKLPGRGPMRALVVRDEGNVIKVAFSENGPEITALPSEVSNKKVGNSTIYPWDQNKWREIVKNPKDYLPEEVEAAKKSLYRLEHKGKDPEETGNSASDDKFAYVMREFDEGKLKTPDGKVVTDPAQAKAIAYSESKKTENGLARARKAIKK